MIRLCAIRIDITSECNRDWLESFSPWAPRIWGVYLVRPGQPTYVGSLAPSSVAMQSCCQGELDGGAPSGESARLKADLQAVDPEGRHLDFKVAQEIIRDGKDAVDLGLFRTEDESLTDCPEAWDAALELIRLAPINWPHD